MKSFYLYYGGATGRLRRFVPNPPLAPRETTSGPQVFCLSYENLLDVGRREDISPSAHVGGAKFKDCVRFNLGFADDIDQRIIKGKRTRASMQLHSWFLRVFVEVCSWSHDCQTTSGSSDLEEPRKCVFSRSGVRIVMSPGDVLMRFPTCFEGTFSLRKASVIVIPMASFIVSSFGDVHKRCMKVLPLSLVFFSPPFCINQRNVFTEHLHGHAGAEDKHMSSRHPQKLFSCTLAATPDDKISPAGSWRAATGFNRASRWRREQSGVRSLPLADAPCRAGARVNLINMWLPLHY